ncbi:MAG: hypothetical protein CSB44_12240 [Gammaproteobacteria bacterium]|nr:MAG: hypothetical protein CSB44_12240 [Gammaproteobacteria bacterium]PIE37588.1 MAG: hypothetical protein CSA54_01120 [Gammaproteobacteria bacterium]
MHLRVPFLLLALLEFCICVAAVYVAVYVRFDGSQITEIESIRSPVMTSLLFGIVMPVTMMTMGLYQSRFRGGILGVFLRSVIGFFVGAAILALLYYLIPPLYLGRGVFAMAIVIAFFVVGTIRPMFFHYVDKDILKVRVLVLGAGDRAASIQRRLRRRADRRGFRILGYVPLPTDTQRALDNSDVVELGERTLLAYAIENEVDEVVVAADDRRSGMPLEQLLECKLYGVDVLELLSFFEREQGKLPLDILRPDWLIYSDGFERGTLRDVIKRVFDIIASLVILILTWPLMLLTMLAIKVEEGLNAPVFYRQVRVGYLGKPFRLLKFRSMRVDAEKAGAQWATLNDSRVTRVGSFIRKTRIDELPQLLNVFRGDMSFVGPRPERPEFVEELSESIPYYRERHAVKPGITGWAQVCYPYGASLQDSVQKQEFDLFYIKNHTIFLDLLILGQTAEVVLFGKGAR